MSRCKHTWRVADREIFPSGMEQLTAAGVSNVKGLTEDLFHKSVIVRYVCPSCGTEQVKRI